MWLTDLQIVLPDGVIERGALQINDGRIAQIVEGDALLDRAGSVVDGSGLILMPGMIDMHGDMLESEVEPRPGVHFPIDMAVFELDKRLAANGITTAYAALSFWDGMSGRSANHRSGEHAHRMSSAVYNLRNQLLIDLRIHARYEVPTPSVAPALVDLLDRGMVHMVSLMDHTPGQGQYRDMEQYVSFIAKWRNASPAEVEAETHERIQNAKNDPHIWRTAADIVTQALSKHLPIASHDDDTVQKIDQMADFSVTISEFPVTLAAAQEARRRGMAVVMGAPNILRGGSHSGNLSAIEAVLAGVVDMLAADYAPAALLQAIFILVDKGILPLHAAVNLVSQNVATALGLLDRGRIAAGLSADLILVEPGPRPRVRGTIRRGVPIYWDAAMALRTSVHDWGKRVGYS
ncbi:alpha-D-ribose 1-methylphosphonate 5-triphosphate diphosphatase [Candidatus Oscillochloris fontis]|uniref:alpha-D-ribose 1-methylphosphonate 5-triphosphate diphosphatase n=1 Tax=Candidatus Oscillochloris fontis TaxID=2496868 RepID=UPI00101CABC0|nr:alpha-D-ribose 1-methylphosphonate 5-triphosphate diphosphatase [Candidatus Oscillochloris fontis]